MKSVRGIPASPGIAIGKAFVFADEEDISIPHYSIKKDDIETEWQRLTAAIEKARVEVTALRDKAINEMGTEQGAIFEAHLLMMDDPDVLDAIKSALHTKLINVEWAVYQYQQALIKSIEGLSDPLLQERSLDVRDVARRIISHLLKKKHLSLSNLQSDIILIAKNLMPSDMVSMERSKVKAIVLDAGGKTSHTAILARSFEIPAVLGLGGEGKFIEADTEVIVDGTSGIVYINPDATTVKRYVHIKAEKAEDDEKLAAIVDLPATTLDGKNVILKANIEVPDEAESVLRHGAQGIGLFRSEFLFLQSATLPDEEAQYAAYRRVIEAMHGKPVTFRTLDIGGDKMVPDIRLNDEKNPLLGWRAIRYCLSNLPLFKLQLRAMLRASAHGEAKIMFPMVSGSEELDAALAALDEAKNECKQQGHKFDSNIAVGVMIEIPSAALIADILAKKVDFFSIGTNDLIQYTIAVDRGNEKVAYLHEPFHPAVLRLIKNVIDMGHAAGITVSMCGEMASDPAAAIVLLGLGLDEFSMSSVSVPDIKRVIRTITFSDAKDIAHKVMSLESHEAIKEFLHNQLRQH